MTSKRLFFLSLIPASWVAILALSYYTKFDPVWFGVVRELATIPIVLGGFVLLLMSFRAWWNERFALRSFGLWAVLMLTISFGLLFTS